MPEYLAPGVYVEEVSYRSKSIEGVSTTTTGFVGPCRYGPIDINPDILTSLGDFERTYGDRDLMQFAGAADQHNYLWHAARAFFEEGGRRLYVSRIFRPHTTETDVVYRRPIGGLSDDLSNELQPNGDYVDGHARGWLRNGSAMEDPGTNDVLTAVQVRARFPGAYGNLKLRFTLRAGRNILAVDTDGNASISGGLLENDIVWIGDSIDPISSPPGLGRFYRAEKDINSGQFRFRPSDTSPTSPLALDTLITSPDLGEGHAVHIVTLTLAVYNESDEEIGAWADLPLNPVHERSGEKDSLFDYFSVEPASALRARQLPVVIQAGTSVTDGFNVLTALFGNRHNMLQTVTSPVSEDTLDQFLQRGIVTELQLKGGNDGARPELTEYEGQDNPSELFKTGLKQFEDLEDISIVAAPGSTQGYSSRPVEARAILGLLISHAQRMRYRIAVLDSGDALSISEVRDLRAKLDSTYAALYYPWVRVLDPVTRAEISLPPSGFVAGIYARNDINRAVYKAPANEVVNLALGFEISLNKSQQEVLNPEGINCIRYFEGRGMLLWGARTISSDPEWKYVNLRRYFAYLERSIDKGTQWAVFEPNGERLWANVRRTVEDFLLNEWQNGALLGDRPEKAYFVKCDRGTMSQNDLDNGRLVCQVGVAALRPAEFVIFRIGQWTGDRKV